jgi:hypothetical protein
MKTLDGTLFRRALDCSGPQSAHIRLVSRAGGRSPLRVMSVALCARQSRVDFRYAPFATELASRCNMSRRAQKATLVTNPDQAAQRTAGILQRR